MEKNREWLLLNAVECWLHYCSDSKTYVSDYKQLRNELRVAIETKDAVVRAETVEDQPVTRTTRTRSTKTKA